MEPGVRVAAALCVLSGGILAALLFRHDAPLSGPAGRDDNGQLIFLNQHQPPELVEPDANFSRLSPVTSAASETAMPRATILSPTDPGERPPPLPEEHPGAEPSRGSGWGSSIELPSSAKGDRPTRPDEVRTHKVVDGDTLEALAERYLGSAEKWADIYEANRDVLPDPQLLPIGAELRIPVFHDRSEPMSGSIPWQPVGPASVPEVVRE